MPAKKKNRGAKYHLEVWLGEPIPLHQLQLNLYPSRRSAVELCRMDRPEKQVITTNKRVLVNGQEIPPHARLTRVDRAGFYVRNDVTVDDFKITIYPP